MTSIPGNRATATTNPAIAFNELVNDILVHILCMLSARDVLHLRETCRRMESISHERTVWATFLVRDVLTSCLPVPGFLFAPTPRLIQLLVQRPQDDALIQSSDFEARTLHAIRLNRTWKQIPRVQLRTFQAPQPVSDLLLLPGGRIAISVHAEFLRFWDLGTHSVRAEVSDRQEAVCISEYRFKDHMANAVVRIDTSLRDQLRPSSTWKFVVCTNDVPTWISEEHQNRRTEVVSLQLDYLRSASPRTHDEMVFAPSVSVFSRPIVLPDILPTPVTLGPSTLPEEYGPHRFAMGKLGKLLLAHDSLLFFASYIPPSSSGEASQDGNKPRYAGIEVVDLSSPGNTTLFEYPDSQLGAYVALHVHVQAAQVVVVWHNCVGLYPLPQLSLVKERDGSPCSPSLLSSSNVGANTTYRLVVMPEIVFALSEPVEAPISFSLCTYDAEIRALDFQEKTMDNEEEGLPPPLTIIARSRGHPSRTVQSALVARISCTTKPSPLASHFLPDKSLVKKALDFCLTRISPLPAMPMFQQAGLNEDKGETVIAALSLGPSGNGVLAHADGTLYRCLIADVVLPHYDSYAGRASRGTVRTVDSWSWKRVADLPARSADNVEAANGEISADRNQPPIVRFDDGMGRLIATFATSSDSQSTVISEVTIMDFI